MWCDGNVVRQQDSCNASLCHAGAISVRGRRLESMHSDSMRSDSSGRLSRGSAARADSLSAISAGRSHLSSDEVSLCCMALF